MSQSAMVRSCWVWSPRAGCRASSPTRSPTGCPTSLRGRLDELQAPLGPGRAGEDGTIAFSGATLRSNLRLLVGMVRANQPERVIARLSRALAVSLGTAAYAMTSSSIWMLSDGMAWPRLGLLAAASIITLCVVLVLASSPVGL